MKRLAAIFLFLFSLNQVSEASIRALFHPFDPTLDEIANYISNAKESVDLALYNIDSSKRNPVISTIASEAIQNRITSGDLKIRILFEGYETKEKNQKKMSALEELGIDARYLGSSRKMHHKFAVIDGSTSAPVLITGSANWSMASLRNYNENILYIEEMPGLSKTFQRHFNLLWSKSKEHGESREYEAPVLGNIEPEAGFEVHFNTSNFKITPKGFRKDSSKKGFALTRQIVALIDQAQSHIEIATTRIKLRPIYEAIKRAAARGVKVDLIVTMGQYEYSYKRRNMKVKSCDDIYKEKCSTSQNFAVFLNKLKYEGKENVSVRLKYFDVRKASYLQKQMHSKYIIVDDNQLITGSFNWSVSAEYNHFENILRVEGQSYPEVLQAFNHDFDRIWTMNRDSYSAWVSELETNARNKNKFKCGFDPMALSFSEIDHMLNSGKRMGTSLSNLCL